MNMASQFSISDLAGYNSNRFDIPLLMEGFLRAQVEFDMKGRRLLDAARALCVSWR